MVWMLKMRTILMTGVLVTALFFAVLSAVNGECPSLSNGVAGSQGPRPETRDRRRGSLLRHCDRGSSVHTTSPLWARSASSPRLRRSAYWPNSS